MPSGSFQVPVPRACRSIKSDEMAPFPEGISSLVRLLEGDEEDEASPDHLGNEAQPQNPGTDPRARDPLGWITPSMFVCGAAQGLGAAAVLHTHSCRLLESAAYGTHPRVSTFVGHSHSLSLTRLRLAWRSGMRKLFSARVKKAIDGMRRVECERQEKESKCVLMAMAIHNSLGMYFGQCGREARPIGEL